MGLNVATEKRLFSMIIRLVHLVTVKGIRRTLKVGFESYIFAYQQFSLSYRSLPDVTFPPEASDFHCRLATINDIERLKVFEPYRRRSEFREWLANGTWVFIAFDGKLPVSFRVASAAPFLQPPWSRISLQKQQLWVVDAYTLPSYRRRGAAQALVNYRDGFLAARGFRESVSFRRLDNETAAAMWANRPSYRPSREVHRLTYLRILFYSRIWMESAAKNDLSVLANPHRPPEQHT